MAEVLVAYNDYIEDPQGRYRARAVGRHAADGMWEGWLEFVPFDSATDVLVSGVESRQPERVHLVYWATGLSPVYLEGALHRARNPPTVRVSTIERPHSAAPAQTVRVTAAASHRPSPVLDPFDVGERSLDILRQELTALNRPRLLNIIAAFDLESAAEDISWMTDAQLVHFIVVAVEMRLPHRTR